MLISKIYETHGNATLTYIYIVTAQDAWGQGLLALQRLRNLSARAVTQDDENALPLLDTWDADAMGRILDIF